MITLLLPVSHVTFSGWQHMALLCNSADKERSNHSRSQMKCDLFCAGFSLTHTCCSASVLSLSSLKCDYKWNHLAVVCWNPPLCLPAPLPSSSFSSTVCCLLYMWHWSCLRNPVQMFSILVQSLLCFQIAAELGFMVRGGLSREGKRGGERQTAGRQAQPPKTVQ